METVIKSATKEVRLNIEGPFVIIGEKINPTGHKKMVAALQEQNYDYIKELAIKQVEAGADVIGVNVGAPGINQIEILPKIAKMVTEAVDVPLCIDSSDHAALKAALAVLPGRPLVNSVNGEASSMEAVLPIVKEFNVPVVGLLMDDNGIPEDAEGRLVIAAKIIASAKEIGICIEDVVVDPLVLTVGANSDAGAITLKTIELVRNKFGVNMSMGASNVSFGMPNRPLLNHSFMSLAMGYGATSAITNPLKMTSVIRSTDLLLGRDKRGKRYLKYIRSQNMN